MPVEIVYKNSSTSRFLHRGEYVTAEQAAHIESEERRRASLAAKKQPQQPLRSVAVAGGNSKKPHRNRSHSYRPLYEVR